MDDKTKAFLALGAATSIVAWSAARYTRISREERAKRKSIKEWETMNLDAIRGSQIRLMQIAERRTFSEFVEACREEAVFLEIIRNQPKY